jgi:hypothetical protein
VRRLLLLLLVAIPAVVQAQSSEFGVNGLGLNSRQMSPRALASGGSFALFDPGSAINPAAVREYGRFNASFMLLQNYRSSTGPASSESGRDTRFPLMAVGGPSPHTSLALGATFATYTDRDFSLAATDTIALNGAPVPVFDTLVSNGGLSDIGLVAAYHKSGWVFGSGLHIITGSARLSLKRNFGDTLYQPVNQKAEISYAGAGFSAGMMKTIGRRAAFAAFVRLDGHANVDRDSSSVAEVDLPVSFGGALRWRPAPRLDLATAVSSTRWGSADADLRGLGGTGGRNTVDMSFGGEWLRDVRTADHLPLRFGIHYRTLPFPVTAGAQPHELGLSLGTGLVVAREVSTRVPTGLVNLTLEHARRSADGGYSESAWMFAAGVTVRP